MRREYQEGDTIIFEIGGETGHYWMQVDDVLGKSLVYLTGDQVTSRRRISAMRRNLAM